MRGRNESTNPFAGKSLRDQKVDSSSLMKSRETLKVAGVKAISDFPWHGGSNIPYNPVLDFLPPSEPTFVP